MSGLPVIIVVAGLIIFGIYLSEKNSDPAISQKTQKASLIGQLAASKVDDRALHTFEKSLSDFIFRYRMVDEVGLTKVFTDDFVNQIPFIGSLAWDPEACGIQSQGRALYFYNFRV